MKIGELKAIVNAIESKYDDMKIHSGNAFLGASEMLVDIDIKHYKGRVYCDLTVEPVGDTGKYTKEFTNIATIAEFIAEGQKIQAIKEMRCQFNDAKGFPLSLRESKDYIDRYLPMGWNEEPGFDCDKAAARFIADHTAPDFLDADEFSV